MSLFERLGLSEALTPSNKKVQDKASDLLKKQPIGGDQKKFDTIRRIFNSTAERAMEPARWVAVRKLHSTQTAREETARDRQVMGQKSSPIKRKPYEAPDPDYRYHRTWHRPGTKRLG